MKCLIGRDELELGSAMPFGFNHGFRTGWIELQRRQLCIFWMNRANVMVFSLNTEITIADLKHLSIFNSKLQGAADVHIVIRGLKLVKTYN